MIFFFKHNLWSKQITLKIWRPHGWLLKCFNWYFVLLQSKWTFIVPEYDGTIQKNWKNEWKSSRVALLSFSKGRQILRVESENWACLLWTKFRIIWTLNTQPAHSLPLIYPFTIKSYISILLAVCHKYWSEIIQVPWSVFFTSFSWRRINITMRNWIMVITWS